MATVSDRFVASTLVARRLHQLWDSQDKADAGVSPATPFKLIKLTYIAHGWSFPNFGGRGLVSEPVEAWQFGPVYPDLYSAVGSYGASPVASVPKNVHEMQNSHVELDGSEVALIDAVYREYKNYDEMQLSLMTHREGTPWHKTWNDGIGSFNVIGDDLIRDYYLSMSGRQT